ncbi:hypothetical protein ACFE04_031331 [Oxalis oulophora]
MFNHPSQFSVHFLGSRLYGGKNSYIPHRFVEAHKDIINVPQKVKLYAREGRVWDIEIELARSGGLVFGGLVWVELFEFYNIKMGYIAVFDFMNMIDEARMYLCDDTHCPVDCLPYNPPSPPPPLALPIPTGEEYSLEISISGSDRSLIIIDDYVSNVTEHVTGDYSVSHSPTTNLDADDTPYSFSGQLRFRLASEEKKFRVLKRPRTSSIGGSNSLRIPTAFVRKNMIYNVKPSHCVIKIPKVGSITSRLTWGKCGYNHEVCIDEFWSRLEKAFLFVHGLYLEFLIDERSDDDEDEPVFEVMVFKADDTLCEPNVHGD